MMAKTNDFRALVLMAAATLLAACLLVLVTAEKPVKAGPSTSDATNGKIAFLSDRQGGYLSNTDDIYVMNADGSNPIPLTTNPVGTIDASPAMSPNGKEIAFLSNRASSGTDGGFDIYVMDAKDDDGDGNGDNLRRLTFSGSLAWALYWKALSWSPDGKRIAFAQYGAAAQDTDLPNNDIWMMPADGSEPPTRLTTNPKDDFGAVFSPDGKEIAFQSNRSGNFDIWEMKPEPESDTTNVPKNLTAISLRNEIEPAFSPVLPDGSTKIAFVSVRPDSAPAGCTTKCTTDRDIYVMNDAPEDAITNPAQNLTHAMVAANNAPTADQYPTWSPDGNQIAFWSAPNIDTVFPDGTPCSLCYYDGADIWVTNVDGSGMPSDLTNNPAVDIQPDWGSAPQKKK